MVLSLERAQVTTIIETALKMFEKEIEHANIVANMEIDQSYIDLAVDFVLVDPSRLIQVVSTLIYLLYLRQSPGADSITDHQLPFQLDQIYKVRERAKDYCQTCCVCHEAYRRGFWHCFLKPTQGTC